MHGFGNLEFRALGVYGSTDFGGLGVFSPLPSKDKARNAGYRRSNRFRGLGGLGFRV